MHHVLRIELKYGRTALRLIRRHERCSRKLARYNNHLTFFTRCIKSHIILRDLRVQPPVPTKGARRVAELVSMRFLSWRIRLTQRAKGDAKKETESTARDITAALTADEASDILEKIRVNTQRVIYCHKRSATTQVSETCIRETGLLFLKHLMLTKHLESTKLNGFLTYRHGPSAMLRYHY